jgi:hypothetical protein
MTVSTGAFDALLPTRIARAEFGEPTLLVAGEAWSLSVTTVWRFVMENGEVVSPSVSPTDAGVRGLVGDTIIAAKWCGPVELGLDPTFRLASGGILQIVSDATFDTWVLHTPELVLVGPLRAE